LIYRVRHKTTYSYEEQVSYARCVLRLTPPSNRFQTLLEHAIAITPTPSSVLIRTGPFDEVTRTIVIDTPHRVLVVEASSRVDVSGGRQPPAEGAAWEDVRTTAFQSSALGAESPAAYLYPTTRTPIVAAITDYARKDFAPNRPVVDAATEFMRRIQRDFVYDAEATTVSTPATEAFRARRGVCQDFAHVMICGLRGLGLPAAYVSGYLRTTPPPGKPRLEGADATHAWVALWCGDQQGWIGFDPTNALVVEDSHIALATGRDYADVAPIGGITLAPGDQALDVAVDVIPEAELRLGVPAG
jgi:transglutaminase-like putative cysteine protease